jgi:hypothetical protein
MTVRDAADVVLNSDVEMIFYTVLIVVGTIAAIWVAEVVGL